MHQKGDFVLIFLFALLSAYGFLAVNVLATTDQDAEEDSANSSGSSGGGIVGTVQNISQPVNILSHSAREDGGYIHVVGEVENGLTRSIDYVKVTGTFYNVNNQVVGTDFVYTDPTSLEAGETAPFDLILYTDAVDPSEVASYKVRVSWS
jgi:hypothetical protein